VQIQHSDGLTFSAELTDCDGTNPSIVAANKCSINSELLNQAPFNIAWGSEVFARVSAVNDYGESNFSPVGGGGVIITKPDPPRNIVENLSMRSLNSVGFTWEQGIENGGSLVQDFSIYYDNGDGTAELIKTQYTQLNYMIDTLEPGVTYGFWIKARNQFGFSDPSEVFYILCATVPDPPVAPLTVTVASDVTISWQLPNENGSPITAYKVYLRAHDGVYIQETVHCSSTTEMVAARSCTMPLLVLISSPYSLALGDSIYAKIVAINVYGKSVYSSAGNGATCVLVPSAPIDLLNDQTVTDTTQIAFTW
jgi:hypothetical protein